MNIHIERYQGGTWQDEGRMAVRSYFQAHPVDDITRGMIESALIATEVYDFGNGTRIRLERRAA